MLSNYHNKAAMLAAVERGNHRGIIGGLWDEIGELQLAFLRGQGLEPHHTLLDIGCGSLRLGVRAVAYLDANRYWGTDLNPELFAAGYQHEIVPGGLAGKLDPDHLVEDAAFAFPGVPRGIDFAIATSVFTHLPISYLRQCLANLAGHVDGPLTFLFSAFVPAGDPAEDSQQMPGIVTHADRDPYHYRFEDIVAAAHGTPWTIAYLGDWGHPRGQRMVRAALA
jgi:hypothetical protein